MKRNRGYREAKASDSSFGQFFQMRYRMVKLVLIIGLLFLAGEVSAYTIYLNRYALVEPGSDIRIADIGRIEGNSNQVENRLVMRSPSRNVQITAADLRERLSGEESAPQNVYGSAIWIIPVQRTLHGDEIADYLSRNLQSRPGSGPFLEMAVFSVDDDQVLKVPADQMEINFPEFERIRPGTLVVSFDIKGSANVLHRQRIPVRIGFTAEVYVSTRDIERGETLSADDFIRERRVLESSGDRLVETPPVGFRALSTIRENDILSAASVQMIPAVRRGQRVEVVFQGQNLVLKAGSIAAEDGFVGDTIDVRILLPSGARSDNRKVRIVGDGIAELTR